MGDAIKNTYPCPNCGATIYNTDSICLVCKGEKVSNPRKPSVAYVGIFPRLAAYMIDSFVIALAIEIYSSFFGFNYPVAVGMYFSYKVFLESSKFQGTLGKGIMGLKITNYKGNKITFDQAVRRYLGQILAFMTFLLGFAMIGFTKKRQGLHDYLAQTLVVRAKD